MKFSIKDMVVKSVLVVFLVICCVPSAIAQWELASTPSVPDIAAPDGSGYTVTGSSSNAPGTIITYCRKIRLCDLQPTYVKSFTKNSLKCGGV